VDKELEKREIRNEREENEGEVKNKRKKKGLKRTEKTMGG